MGDDVDDVDSIEDKKDGKPFLVLSMTEEIGPETKIEDEEL